MGIHFARIEAPAVFPAYVLYCEQLLASYLRPGNVSS